MKTVRELAQAISPEVQRITGMIRRMAITLTTRVAWQLAGFRMPDGTTETISAEPFTGIGVFARPPSNSKPEAIVLNVGDAKAPVIVAVRDEKTRAAIAGNVGADETAVYNSQAIVLVKANGSIEVRAAAGVAVPLATKADLDALKAAINGAPTTGGDGGAAFKAALLDALAAWPVGTTVLKGQ